MILYQERKEGKSWFTFTFMGFLAFEQTPAPSLRIIASKVLSFYPGPNSYQQTYEPSMLQ